MPGGAEDVQHVVRGHRHHRRGAVQALQDQLVAFARGPRPQAGTDLGATGEQGDPAGVVPASEGLGHPQGGSGLALHAHDPFGPAEPAGIDDAHQVDHLAVAQPRVAACDRPVGDADHLADAREGGAAVEVQGVQQHAVDVVQRFARYGGREFLELVDVDAPHARAGQIRITVRAADVNGLEGKIRQGLLQDVRPLRLPAGIGGDAAGIVDEIGDGVTDVQVGDAVFGSGPETYAEHAVLTSWAPKPPQVSFTEAAGFATPFETALRVLDDAGVHSGHTVVVNGASGGVGSAAVQFAVGRGATVVGIAGPSNQRYLVSLGAIPATYGPDLVDRIRALAPAGVVDAAVDIAGSGIIPELVALTGDPGRVVSIADFSATEHGARVSTGFGRDKTHALREGARLTEAGRLTLPVTRTFPLAQAGAAQVVNATGHVRGRTVITVP